jgi:ABC-type multidrug transport system ATPase subunit
MLADRKLVGSWSGEILVDGKARTDDFRLRTAYVLQDDVHIATLTVEECVYYAVWTRVPTLVTHESRQERVDNLLKMLGIDHVRKSIVGDPMRKGISGGQMKRLSIAVELVTLPDVVFLDEPTSGLDSSIALEVMSAVRDIVGKFFSPFFSFVRFFLSSARCFSVSVPPFSRLLSFFFPPPPLSPAPPL